MAERFKNYYLTPEHLNGHAAQGCLLLRHAEREPILTWEDIPTADLTEQGRQQAYAAGKMLAARAEVDRIYSSPILRCMHTAEEIGRGYQEGTGVRAPVAALPALHYDVRRWNAPDLPQIALEDQGLAGLFARSDQGDARRLAAELLRQALSGANDQLVVAITHDTVITLVAGAILGAAGLTVTDSPGFLQGVLVQPIKGETAPFYRLVPIQEKLF